MNFNIDLCDIRKKFSFARFDKVILIVLIAAR